MDRRREKRPREARRESRHDKREPRHKTTRNKTIPTHKGERREEPKGESNPVIRWGRTRGGEGPQLEGQ